MEIHRLLIANWYKFYKMDSYIKFNINNIKIKKLNLIINFNKILI